MFYCVPCHDTDEKTEAVWYVWPDIKSSWTPYTYMCTDCLINAIQHGMAIPNLKIERDINPDNFVPVSCASKIKPPEEIQQPSPENVIQVDFAKSELP